MQRLPNTYGAAMPQMTEQARQRSAGDWSGEISRMPMEPIRQTPAGQGGMSGPMGAAGAGGHGQRIAGGGHYRPLLRAGGLYGLVESPAVPL